MRYASSFCSAMLSKNFSRTNIGRKQRLEQTVTNDKKLFEKSSGVFEREKYRELWMKLCRRALQLSSRFQKYVFSVISYKKVFTVGIYCTFPIFCLCMSYISLGSKRNMKFLCRYIFDDIPVKRKFLGNFTLVYSQFIKPMQKTVFLIKFCSLNTKLMATIRFPVKIDGYIHITFKSCL